MPVLSGVGLGTTPSTSPTTPTNTLGSGLSEWMNPLTAITEVPGAVTAFTSAPMFSIGLLLVPVALIAVFAGMSGGGRRR